MVMRCLTVPCMIIALVCCLLAGVQAQEVGEGLPTSVRQEVLSPQKLPKGRYVPVRTWSALSADAQHKIGHAVNDAEAEGGQAWEAQVGRDNVNAGALLYGPYLPMPPGDYVAFFRIKLLEEAGEEEVAIADVATDYGQNTLTFRHLTGSDLAVNRYVEVPIPFHYPGGPLECRVIWQGYSGLRVAQVALFRLEGGHIENGGERAPQPTPTGIPKNLSYYTEPRPFPEIFPRSSAPASHMVVFDLSRQNKDWQLAILCLQGIVNRTKPRLYCLVNPPDSDWLDWMKKRKWIQETETVATPEALLKKFRSSIKGIIVIDPTLPASKNVATMLASLRDGIAVSPRIAKTLDLPVLEDLRGRWKTSSQAYRWAFGALWPRLNHHLTACIYPDQMPLRDYLVENRVFLFWLSGQVDGARPYANPQEEVALMEELLAKMPVNIPVMSYPYAGKDVGIGEGPGVTLFAEFGKYLVGSTDASNLSVHSGIPIKRLRQSPAPPAPKLDSSKVYFSWIISDGDNLPVLSHFNFPPLWKSKERGQFPIGWTASPSALMLLPDVMDYYYSTATPNDMWLGAVSGIGYTYPDSYGLRYRAPDRQRIFDGFLDQTADYMRRMDENILWPMNVTRPELIAHYAERIPFLQALFPDYGRRVAGYQEATYPTVRNVPVFHALTTWQEGDSREQQIASLVAQVRALAPAQHPAFMHLFIWNWGADLSVLQEVQRQLGPDYVAVRPDHLAALYRQYLEQEKVLVRAPTSVIGIVGYPLSFTATVQNVTDKPQELTLMSPGLKYAEITPPQARLAPSQSATFQISIRPESGEVTLAVRGAFGTHSSPLAFKWIPPRELSAPLPTDALLRFVRQIPAAELSKSSGRMETDPSALQGTTWVVRKGEGKTGHVLFGPYTSTPKGRYLAVFRLKRITEGSGPVVTLDTCVGGGEPITASRVISTDDLPLDKYRSFGLMLDHPGGPMETRVLWTGNADIAVDSVILFQEIPR